MNYKNLFFFVLIQIMLGNLDLCASQDEINPVDVHVERLNYQLESDNKTKAPLYFIEGVVSCYQNAKNELSKNQNEWEVYQEKFSGIMIDKAPKQKIKVVDVFFNGQLPNQGFLAVLLPGDRMLHNQWIVGWYTDEVENEVSIKNNFMKQLLSKKVIMPVLSVGLILMLILYSKKLKGLGNYFLKYGKKPLSA